MSTINLRVGNDALTFQELDNNFTNLNNDKYESGDNPSFVGLTLTKEGDGLAKITSPAPSGGNDTQFIQFAESTSNQGFVWIAVSDDMDVGSSNDIFYVGDSNLTDWRFKVDGAGQVYTSTGNAAGANFVAQRIFADNYHPNADRWTTDRTLTIGGTGKTVNGTASVSWSLAEIGVDAAGTINYVHPQPTRTNNTSTQTATAGGTFTAIDSVSSNANGHITAVNTKTVTLPADNNTDTLQSIANDTSSSSRYVTFVNSATGAQTGKSSGLLRYKPNEAILSVGNTSVSEVQTSEVSCLSNQQLVLNAGESRGTISSAGVVQNAEIIYMNAENGVQINSSSNNWVDSVNGNWAGTVQTLTLNDSNGNSSFPGNIVAGGTVGGSNLSGTNTGDEPNASATARGIVELATVTEVNAGTDTTRAVTPAGIAGFTGSANVVTVGTISSGTWQGGIISTAYLENQSGTNTGDEPDATTSVKGIIEIAGPSEVTAGTDTTRAITPSSLTSITKLGTIGTGTWQGSVIASAYLDADTAHLSGSQTFTGAKTFNANTTVVGILDVRHTNVQMRLTDTTFSNNYWELDHQNGLLSFRYNGGTGAFTLAHDTSDATFAANVDITGTLTATSKSFDIEHPTKENMRLRYGSLEGPENGVYVRGKLSNTKVIELPDYWTGLVHEDTITVSLTPIGSNVIMWVDKVEDNKVYIEAIPSIFECYYHVFAERKDIDKLTVEY